MKNKIEKRLFSEIETSFWQKRSIITLKEINKIIQKWQKGKYKTFWIAVNEIDEILNKYKDYKKKDEK